MKTVVLNVVNRFSSDIDHGRGKWLLRVLRPEDYVMNDRLEHELILLLERQMNEKDSYQNCTNKNVGRKGGDGR